VEPVSCFVERVGVAETADRDQSKSARGPATYSDPLRDTVALEQGPEQKRAKAHRNARLLRKRRDPHRRRVGIGGSKIEPEVEKRHHAIVRLLSRIRHAHVNDAE
jgi:hypothetical protein